MQFELKVQTRSVQGTSASRRLRRANKVPGIVYGGTAAVTLIEVDHNTIYLALKKEAFHSAIISLSVDDKKEQVLLRDFQVHAYKPRVHHIDFQRVDATQALHIKVPLHFINEENCPGVKADAGLVNHVMTEIDVKCLPKDLPSFIEVDLIAMKSGSVLHVADLKLPNGVKAVLHAGENPVVVNIVGRGSGVVEEESTDAAATTAPPAA